MIRLAAAAGLALAAAGGAQAELVWQGCVGARAELLLLPEDLEALDGAAPGALTVTGAYTGVEPREGGAPRPVGAFVSAGRVANRQVARMDGVAVVEADGRATVGVAAEALRDPARRGGYLDGIVASGGALMQSHLLIRDGALDLRRREEAPTAVRRLLLQGPDGALSVWQSREALTLYDAAAEALAEAAPAMALNLDMGGHDFCEAQGASGPRLCGLIGRDGLSGFSNLLRLTPGC
ncbi:MAG: hypothetical protein AAF192_05185 [Pseudomonadota bacterium]